MKPLIYLYMFNVLGVVLSSSINCPLSETEWTVRSKTKLCQGYDVYHCLLVEDGKSRKEKCIEKTLILQENCPIFSNEGYIHWKKCNTTGCPDTAFRSDEVYKYPVCYGHIDVEENDVKSNGIGSQPLSDNSEVTLIIGITMTFLVLALAVVAFLLWKYRRQDLKCFSGPTSSNMDIEFRPLTPKGFSGPTSSNMDNESRPLISKDDFITNGIEILENKKVLYLIGHLGNSVSTTGKQIAEDFANQEKMSCKFWNYLRFFEDPSIKSNSVMFIDGWGGLWNANPCEKELTLETLELVVKKSNPRDDVKFVIGLCSKVQHAYNHELHQRGILFEDDETLILDSMSKYKRETVKEEIQSIKNSCENEPCECKSFDEEQISDIIRADNNVRIGMYLILKLIGINHALKPNFLQEGPLVAMRRHFQKMLECKQTLSWMSYIVCMGYYDENDLRQEIANAFKISNDALSNRDDIDKYAKLIDKEHLAPMWSSRFPCYSSAKQESNSEQVHVFQHNFLYICAFHAFYNKYPDEIMRFCNVDAILQLVRPEGHPAEPFTIRAEDKHLDIFCERIKSFVDDSTWSVHPLIKHWKTRQKN